MKHRNTCHSFLSVMNNLLFRFIFIEVPPSFGIYETIFIVFMHYIVGDHDLNKKCNKISYVFVGKGMPSVCTECEYKSLELAKKENHKNKHTGEETISCLGNLTKTI